MDKLILLLIALVIFFPLTNACLLGLFGCEGQSILIIETEADLNISQLGDVTVSGVTNNQILVFNSSTLQWENRDQNQVVILVSTGFLTSFTDSDLNSDGILNIQHDSNRQYPTVTIYDSNELILLPDDVTFEDIDNVDVNLLSQTPLVGTWHLRVEAGEAEDVNNLFIRLDGTNDQDITAQIQFPAGILLPNTQDITLRDSDINIFSSADSILNINSDGNIIIDANTIQFNRGCIKIEDTDHAGFTFCTTLNGVLSCSTTPC